jgi:hypothetical protein
MHYVDAAKWLAPSLRDQAFAESGSRDTPETLHMVANESDGFSSAPAKYSIELEQHRSMGLSTAGFWID